MSGYVIRQVSMSQVLYLSRIERTIERDSNHLHLTKNLDFALTLQSLLSATVLARQLSEQERRKKDTRKWDPYYVPLAFYAMPRDDCVAPTLRSVSTQALTSNQQRGSNDDNRSQNHDSQSGVSDARAQKAGAGR